MPGWVLGLTIAMLLLSACSGAQIAAPSPTPTLVDVSAEDVLVGLKARGIDPGKAQPMTQPFLHVTGHVYTGVGAGLQLYEYPDAAAAAADAEQIIPERPIEWVDDPHFYHAERLIALYVGHDEKILQALREILGEPFANGKGWERPLPSPSGTP